MTVPAYDHIRAIALQRIEMERLDPESDRSRIAAAIDTAVTDYQRRALESGSEPPLRDPGQFSWEHRPLFDTSQT